MARFLSPRWLVRHTLVVVLVATFLSLGWWQIGRAAHGNPLSLGYAVEWPLFAAFVVAVWVREIRVELRRSDPSAATGAVVEALAPNDPAQPAGPAPAGTAPGYVPFRAVVRPSGVAVTAELAGDGEAEDAPLAAYNRYLAWLGANPDRAPGDYPG